MSRKYKLHDATSRVETVVPGQRLPKVRLLTDAEVIPAGVSMLCAADHVLRDAGEDGRDLHDALFFL